MSKFIIEGKKPLSGEIRVVGAKNAALKIFPAVFLTDEPMRVVNVPDIEDVKRAEETTRALGHEVKKINDHEIELQAKNKRCIDLPESLVNKFRFHLFDFHEVPFAIPLIFFAFYFLERNNYLLTSIFLIQPP